MRKVLVITALLISTAAYGATKVDPMFGQIRSAERRADLNIVTNMAVVESVDGRTLVGVLIKTTDIDVVSDKIIELGGTVGTELETVITARIPIEVVEEIAALDEVVYIEASKKLTPKMNYARSSGITNVVDVQPTYTGSGVIFGLYDSGLDCSNTDFQDAAGATRIINYWKVSTNKKYTAAEIAAGDCADAGYHGTHVTGIAAGSNGTYTGVAPAASIVAVEMNTGDEAEVVNAISYIFQKAQALLAPVVVNLSLGTSMGPHDGTSNFETGINETLSGKVGRAITCAAGNENVNPNDDTGGNLGGLHALVNVSGTDIGYEAIIRLSSVRSLTMDIWLAQGGNCKIELAAYDAARTQVLTTGEVAAAETAEETKNNLTLAMNFTDSDNANNHKQHAQGSVSFTSGTYSSIALTYDLIFRDQGGGCSGHAWLYEDYVAYNDFTDDLGGTAGPTGDYTYANGDSNYMITVPGTATGCITVASFSARDSWVDIDGDTKYQNVYDASLSGAQGTGTSATDISLFSSLGPGAGTANTQKPDITTPGEPIISTFASNYSTSNRNILGDATHIKLEGTSMSSPLAAGMVALMFQKNGCLTPAEVKSKLTGAAMAADAFTGSLPNYTWGYGRADALAAVNAVTASSCQPDNPSDNPATGKSGCSLVVGTSGGSGAGLVVLVLFVLWIVRRCHSQKWVVCHSEGGTTEESPAKRVKREIPRFAQDDTQVQN